MPLTARLTVGGSSVVVFNARVKVGQVNHLFIVIIIMMMRNMVVMMMILMMIMIVILTTFY